jgi:hypothetical protein
MLMPFGRSPWQQTAYVKALHAFRRACTMQMERSFSGHVEILNFLRSIDCRKAGFKPITERTLKLWIYKRGFPVYKTSCACPPQTTNFHVLAWLWSLKPTDARRRPKRPAAAPRPDGPGAGGGNPGGGV